MQGDSSQSLEGLLGHVPDPERDRVALLGAINGTPASARLVRKLHTDEDWRRTPLGDLLPGLGSIGSPGDHFPPLSSARAVNCLLSARIEGWPVLADWTPADLSYLPNLGRLTLEEVLALAVREWARFHLEDPTAPSPAEIYDGLVALSAWGASTRGTRGAVAAIAAAAETEEKLPAPVNRAMRALRSIDESETEFRRSLESAFLKLEAMAGFTVFKRRHPKGSAKPPSLSALAREMDVTRSRVEQLEASVQRKFARGMKDPDWPIRLATEQLRERLGTVARSGELDDAFASLDPGHSAGPNTKALRRALLLQLCDYRVGEEWVVGPDIESLTDVILAAVANGERTDLDAVSRHLTLLGVREEMQLGWILSRGGFRIMDDRIVSVP
jgi:hypothetical protein